MKNFFEFKKVNHAFRWESNFMALEFSNPIIQGFSDFIHLTNEKEIMYYYYTVKIFKKEMERNGEWELFSERDAYDFPTILSLRHILDYQLKDNPVIDGQKIESLMGNVRYSKTITTGGFACDDFYEITKSVDSEGNDEQYIVYCGTTFDFQGDLNSCGIRTPYVTKKDVEELLRCVVSFIQYSLEKHNKHVNILANSYETKNNKIYEYDYDYENGTIDKNKIESIYAIGDRLNITIAINNQEKSYNKVVITKIEGEELYLNNGHVIKSNTIRHISNEPTSIMLKYKESEIAEEFWNILSSEEKDEFKQGEVERLLEKYKKAIVDRTWMCREDHQFDIDYHTGDPIGAVTPVVEEIIELIKDGGFLDAKV